MIADRLIKSYKGYQAELQALKDMTKINVTELADKIKIYYDTALILGKLDKKIKIPSFEFNG